MLYSGKFKQKIDHHPSIDLERQKGQIIGGNLSILYSLMGSPSDLNTDGKILFIEDFDEYLYHIDRMDDEPQKKW